MIAVDEDDLICDLAETYHILDYRQLPLTAVAVFACGLKDSSRIKMVMSGQTVPSDTLLLAQMTDALNLLVWSRTKDAEADKNRPRSIASALLGEEVSQPDLGFDTGADFEREKQRLIGGVIDGN